MYRVFLLRYFPTRPSTRLPQGSWVPRRLTTPATANPRIGWTMPKWMIPKPLSRSLVHRWRDVFIVRKGPPLRKGCSRSKRCWELVLELMLKGQLRCWVDVDVTFGFSVFRFGELWCFNIPEPSMCIGRYWNVDRSNIPLCSLSCKMLQLQKRLPWDPNKQVWRIIYPSWKTTQSAFSIPVVIDLDSTVWCHPKRHMRKNGCVSKSVTLLHPMVPQFEAICWD